MNCKNVTECACPKTTCPKLLTNQYSRNDRGTKNQRNGKAKIQ